LVFIQSQDENWLIAYQAASTAVLLIPLLSPSSLAKSNVQHLINFVDLASDTAALALKVGKSVYKAIQFLEIGCGIIPASLSQTHADISELQRHHPELAGEFSRLRDQFNIRTRPIGFIPQADQRNTVSQKLEQMKQNIRKLPRFQRFLIAPSENS
jgi:hypothetical protein